METTEFIRSPIRQLSDQLANQIAAGEVVERPASIVKELIENSLDAGATTIEIEIMKGGFELIKIRDNGCGIPKQEIALAVQAHCTSKISNFDDLTSIESMGFRGEALASIVSVSRFEITSSTSSQDMAWSWFGYERAGSKKTGNENSENNNSETTNSVNNLIPASHPIGTSIFVRDIFYNTMARRKFLRSERTEFRHIEDVVKRIALSRFDVEIVLKHNNRVVHRLTSTSTPELKIKRIEKLLDKKFIQHAVQVSYQASQLTMTGWLSNKDYSRGQTDMQYFYVNGRMIKDKVINHALRQVYQSILPPGRFPAYVLNLQIEPQQVDVNVHPTKHEVRFRQMRLVHDFVNHVIQDSLAKINSNISSNSGNENSSYNFDDIKNDSTSSINESSLYESTASNVNSQTGVSYRGSSSAEHHYSPQAYANENSETGKSLFTLGEFIGFCKPCYLISQSEDGMVIMHLLRVKQHNVELNWLMQFKENNIEIKPFIFPISITIDGQLAECVDLFENLIQLLGFDLSLHNSNVVLLRAIPSLLQHCQHESLVIQLLTSLQMEKNISESELIQLLSRFVELDDNIESQSNPDWNQYLRSIENTFESVCQESPYKNKLWRVMSLTEINKLFQSNVSFDLHLDG